jgi:hypothetical protein
MSRGTNGSVGVDIAAALSAAFEFNRVMKSFGVEWNFPICRNRHRRRLNF